MFLKTNILINRGIYRLFYTDRPIKRKLISTVIPTLLPHKQTSTAKKTSEIRAKQKEKEETGFRDHKSNGFKEVLI